MAALVAVRAVAGEGAARRAAPFVALAPTALWLGTSADALVAGVAAAGVALVVAAAARPGTWRAAWCSGPRRSCLYGVVPLLALPVGVAVLRRDPRPVARAAVGGAAVVLAFAAAGFWWLDGLAATRLHYAAGVAPDRPYGLFVALFNPAALALAVGPATVVAFAVAARPSGAGRGGRRLPRAALALPLAAVGAVAVADLSGLSKGEVERIWLPFTPWLLAAAGARPGPPGRAWLAAQAALSLVLAVALRSPW